MTNRKGEILERNKVGPCIRQAAIVPLAAMVFSIAGCRGPAVQDGTYLVGEKYFREMQPPPDITRRDMALELHENRFSMWGMKGSFDVKGSRLKLKPASKEDKARMIMYDKLRLPKEGESGELSLRIEDSKTLVWERPSTTGGPTRYVIYRWQGE